MRSSLATRYQLGFVDQAGWVTAPPSASTPHGTCESAMKAARLAGTSAANEAANFSRSGNRNPSCGGRIGGAGAAGGGGGARRGASERGCARPAGAGREGGVEEGPGAFAVRPVGVRPAPP